MNDDVNDKLKLTELFMAKDQWKLGEQLDELVLMILDFGLNNITPKSTEITNVPFHFN